MMNNKGFILIEIMGVLIILSIISFITVINMTRLSKETNDKILTSQLKVIEDATKDYLLDKNDIYTDINKSTYCIEISSLIDNGNLNDNLISSLDSNLYSVVKITYDDNRKAQYEITNSCTEEVSSNVEFTLVGEKNVIIEVGDGGQYNEQGAKVFDENGNAVVYTTSITNSNNEIVSYIETTKIDLYSIKYSATIDGKAHALERIVKVRDTKAPNITAKDISITVSSTLDFNDYITIIDNSGEKLFLKLVQMLIQR